MSHLNFSLLCIILLLSLNGFAQKTKKSSGEYQLRLKNTGLNEEEACEECIQKARINAIEKAFGTVIIQGNTTYIENVNSGKKTETKSIFNTYKYCSLLLFVNQCVAESIIMTSVLNI